MSYGLVFDMDGVLADTESLIARATIEVYRGFFGLELKPEDFRPYIGTGAYRYTVGPAEERGIEIDADKAMQQRHDNFVRLLEAGECRPCPGALELADMASAAPDWKLAVATSSPEQKAKATWKAIGLPLAKFSALVTGDHVTHKKPHPEIYVKTFEQLGLAPDSCVVVEDAVTGVEAAKAAGAHCLAVTNSFGAGELAQADRVTASLAEVDMATLEGILRGGAQ